ncbi:MAG: PEP-CTERM sorting domain-containing protein [Gemmatimonas sp.]
MNRQTRIACAVGIVAALSGFVPASAQIRCGNEEQIGVNAESPSVTVCANGNRYDIEGVLQDGKLGLLRPTKIDLGNGASFNLDAAFDADPFIAFTFASILPAGFGPLSFDVYFSTPVVGGPYNYAMSNYTSAIAGTIPVGAAGGTGSISAGTNPFYLSGLGNATNLGVDVGTATCSVTMTAVVNCPPGNAANSFAPFSPSTLTAHLSYTHSHTGVGSSSANFMGRVDLLSTTVPEPSTLVLMCISIVLVGAAARRRAS